MQSKAEVIKAELAGKRVLDIGGCGFGADNAYINAIGSLFPAWVGTGIMIHCRRK